MKFSVSSNKLLYYCLQLNKNIIEEVLGVLGAYSHLPYASYPKFNLLLRSPRALLTGQFIYTIQSKQCN